MIIIDEKFRINGDGTCWTVEEFKGKKIKKGKEGNDVEYDCWESLTFHSRVESALDSVLNLKMKNLPDMHIREFLTTSIKIKKELQEFLKIGTWKND